MSSAAPHLPDHGDTGAFLAWMDVGSLHTTICGSSIELGAQLGNSGLGRPLPELARAYLHERVHLYQSLTTCFGLYTWLLQWAQTTIVGFLMHRLVRRCNVPLKSPLREYVRTLPNRHWDVVKDLLDQWDWLEAALSELTAAPSYFVECQSAGLNLNWDSQFRYVQASLGYLYSDGISPQAWGEWRGRLERELGKSTATDIPQEMLDIERFLAPELFSLVGVMESAAYAYELAGWGQRREYMSSVRQGTYGEGEYTLLLQETKRALRNGTRKQSILAAHLALCDLALNPPILPQHERVRDGISIQELHPVARIATLWASAGEVAPPKSLDESPRYEIELAEFLGWASPVDIISAGGWHGAMSNNDPRDHLYVEALHSRQSLPTIFYDPRLIYSTQPAIRRLFQVFDFPIVQCDDGWVYPTDPQNGFAVIRYYLFHQWHRQLFLGDPENLVAPSGTPDAVIQAFCDEAEMLLSDELAGQGVNGPTVYVAPSAS